MRTKNKDKELNHRHFIGLRLTDVELDLLDQGAACLSISRSEYLRKLLLEKQLRRRIPRGQWAIRWIIHRLPLLNLLTLVHGVQVFDFQHQSTAAFLYKVAPR